MSQNSSWVENCGCCGCLIVGLVAWFVIGVAYAIAALALYLVLGLFSVVPAMVFLAFVKKTLIKSLDSIQLWAFSIALTGATYLILVFLSGVEFLDAVAAKGIAGLGLIVLLALLKFGLKLKFPDEVVEWYELDAPETGN